MKSIAMIAAGTVIEGQYEVWEEVSRFDHEVLYAGLRLSDGADIDVRVVAGGAPRPRRKQFSDVASIVARLDHANCLSAVATGQLVDRTLYIVTESLNAGPLSGLAGGTVPARALAEIGQQLLAGLAHLHAQGIILGCVTPDGVTLGERLGRPLLQLVDFSFARVADKGGPQPECKEERFLAPEVVAGAPATELSDLFSAGHVLRSLAGPDTPEAILEVCEALAHPDPHQRATVHDARRHFEAWIEGHPGDFEMAWLPVPSPAAISTGVFTIAEPDWGVSPSDSFEVMVPVEASQPSSVATSLASPSGSGPDRGRFAGLMRLAVVGAGLAVVAALGVVGLRGASGEPEASPPPLTAALSVGAAAVPPPSNEAPAPRAEAAADDSEHGNPIVWLAQVNRRDLGAVLPIRERRRLLDELATRRGVDDRVNHRWNAMLDLWQAGDAERPCATFATALASLSTPPRGDSELDLIRRVVVPTPAQGSAAGRRPDESCDGLEAAFDTYVAASKESTERAKRSSSRRPTKRTARPPTASAKPSPPAAPSPSSSVATKLDAGLREL